MCRICCASRTFQDWPGEGKEGSENSQHVLATLSSDLPDKQSLQSTRRNSEQRVINSSMRRGKKIEAGLNLHLEIQLLSLYSRLVTHVLYCHIFFCKLSLVALETQRVFMK